MDGMLPLDDDNPTHRTPFVTWALIAANVLAFLWQLDFGLERSVMRFGFIPADLSRGDMTELPHSLYSMFMHGGWLHLLGNVWFLRIFGDNIEDELGHLKFLIFYLLCGFAADAAHYISAPMSKIPVVGASGAISAVLGAYMIRHPTARVRAWTGFWFHPIAELPAIVFLFFWAAMQFLMAVSTIGMKGGGVAYWAHLGGFIAGVIFILIFGPRRRAWKPGEW